MHWGVFSGRRQILRIEERGTRKKSFSSLLEPLSSNLGEKESVMNRFLLWKRGWWALHVLAVAFMFWLGHFMRF
jgi:hypothetical protein